MTRQIAFVICLVAVAGNVQAQPASRSSKTPGVEKSCVHQDGQPNAHLERACTRQLRQSGHSVAARADFYRFRGFHRYVRGRHYAAAWDFDAGLRLAPRDGRLHRLAADAAERMRNFDKMSAHLSLALKYNPNSAATHEFHGEVMRKYGRMEGSLPSFERAVELESNRHYSRYWIARILTMKQRYEQALAEIEQILQQPASAVSRTGTINLSGVWVDVHVASRMLKGEILQRLDRHKEAEQIANRLIEEKPSADRYAYRAGVVMAIPLAPGETSRHAEAEIDAKRATELAPAYQYGWRLYATTLQYGQKHAEALVAMDRALTLTKLSTVTAPMLWLRSRILQDLQRRDEAVTTGVSAFSVAMATSPTEVAKLSHRISHFGYWPAGELPSEITTELVDAIRACRTDPQCW